MEPDPLGCGFGFFGFPARRRNRVFCARFLGSQVKKTRDVGNVGMDWTTLYNGHLLKYPGTFCSSRRNHTLLVKA